MTLQIDINIINIWTTHQNKHGGLQIKKECFYL